MRFLLFICILLTTSMAAHGQDAMEAKKTKARAAAAEIVTMRSDLAKNFIKPDMEITEETFNKVCGAVGKRVKEIMATDGLTIRHVALKYRNPANAPKPAEMEDLQTFEKYPTLHDKWDEVEIDKKKYVRYQRSILVEKACLACHGAKNNRPQFIVGKYPDDKAYDFKAGDFRAVIMVLIKKE